jgi:hypothetical protein
MGKYSDEMDLQKAIRLTGLWGDFTVHHDIPGQEFTCTVPTAGIGHTIVRALRQHQRDLKARDASSNGDQED